MSLIRLQDVRQQYGEVRALDGVSLDVEEGEFLTLLGPSGCGKTTLLRVIAGFIRPTEGSVVIDGADVTGAPAHRRPVNMVFQRPTLFPHLDVAGNIAFGLKLESRRPSKGEIAERVAEALALVRLEGYERRRAHELSGGQMQRVALARALVKRPKVLLLDEPLSALDLKIRLGMEVELRRVHRETGATFVYVTHDQREALALSDRIAVFDSGRIIQLDAPDLVYRRPADPFVARFVGDANVLSVEVRSGAVALGGGSVAVAELDGPCWLVVRPETIALGAAGAGIRGEVVDVAFRGTGTAYRLRIEGLEEHLKVEVPGSDPPRSIGDAVSVVVDPVNCLLLRRS